MAAAVIIANAAAVAVVIVGFPLSFFGFFSVFLEGFPNFHKFTRIAFVQFEKYAVLSSPRSLQNSAHTRNGFGAQ